MRRDFIKGIVGSATAWPLAARAQQADRVRRIGVIMPFASDDAEALARLAAFQQALQDLGWSADRNVQFEYRSSAGDSERNHPLICIVFLSLLCWRPRRTETLRSNFEINLGCLVFPLMSV
jgi:hypothetical protein